MANINLQISFSHPDAISNTIRYARIDNTNNPVFTTLTGVTTSPLLLQNVPNGQYRIGITPIYADNRICLETFQDTPPCTGIVSFSAVLSGGNLVISYNAVNTVPDVQVNISYPNGGQFSNTYVNNGANITITPPANVFGNYTITLQPVCDVDSGFLGAPTAPVIINIQAPNNSTLTNSTAGSLAPISLTAFTAGSQLIFTSSNIASGGIQSFFLADTTYNSIVVNYGSGTVASASLVTGSGTYPGVLTTGAITFNTVTAVGGVTITIH
jgi:hypothetical protein